MIEPTIYEFCSEFYIVEKTVELVLGNEEIRIEALLDPNEPGRNRYKTRCYIKKDVTLQPTYPNTSSSGSIKFERKPENMQV